MSNAYTFLIHLNVRDVFSPYRQLKTWYARVYMNPHTRIHLHMNEDVFVVIDQLMFQL